MCDGTPDAWRQFKCNLCQKQFEMRWPFDSALKLAMFEHLKEAHGIVLHESAPISSAEISAADN